MKLVDFRSELKKVGVPVQYRAFKEGEAPELPYIIFYLDDTTGSLEADNKLFWKLQNVSAELYTDEKDVELEEKLEQIFEENEISFDAYESYIDSEQMFEMLYEITI